ncbi:MAG: hypothetical protein ACOC1K_01100 [Nanoarchaeota archaeon]
MRVNISSETIIREQKEVIKRKQKLFKEENENIDEINCIIYNSETIFNPYKHEYTNRWVKVSNK